MSMENVVFAIENVLRSKNRGRVTYQGSFGSSQISTACRIKRYDDPSGFGYQRPVNKKRCKKYADYLAEGDGAIVTSILLNAGGKWEFTPYDPYNKSIGRLTCQGPASLMDGQHRVGGLEMYLAKSGVELMVPFMAFHWLTDEEEMEMFRVINSEQKGIDPSLSTYLKQRSDDTAWVATQLIVNSASPFHGIGTLTGNRRREMGIRITLQNLVKVLNLLTVQDHVADLAKETKLQLTMAYFNAIRETLPHIWVDYENYRLTDTAILNALAIAGADLLAKAVGANGKISMKSVMDPVKKLKSVDWKRNGDLLSFVNGMTGSRALAEELMARMQPARRSTKDSSPLLRKAV